MLENTLTSVSTKFRRENLGTRLASVLCPKAYHLWEWKRLKQIRLFVVASSREAVTIPCIIAADQDWA